MFTTSAWSQNLYTYVGNNPVNMVDPTGHSGLPNQYYFITNSNDLNSVQTKTELLTAIMNQTGDTELSSYINDYMNSYNLGTNMQIDYLNMVDCLTPQYAGEGLPLYDGDDLAKQYYDKRRLPKETANIVTGAGVASLIGALEGPVGSAISGGYKTFSAAKKLWHLLNDNRALEEGIYYEFRISFVEEEILHYDKYGNPYKSQITTFIDGVAGPENEMSNPVITLNATHGPIYTPYLFNVPIKDME